MQQSEMSRALEELFKDAARLDAIQKLDLTIGRCNGSWHVWGKRIDLMDQYSNPRQAIDAAIAKAQGK